MWIGQEGIWQSVDLVGRTSLHMEHGIEEKAETDDMELSRKTQEGAQRAQPYLGAKVKHEIHPVGEMR